MCVYVCFDFDFLVFFCVFCLHLNNSQVCRRLFLSLQLGRRGLSLFFNVLLSGRSASFTNCDREVEDKSSSLSIDSQIGKVLPACVPLVFAIKYYEIILMLTLFL